MNPGLLDRRLTLESLITSQDTVGGKVESWSTVAQIWGQQVNQRQIEKIVADTERNVETRQFRIRWRSGLDSGSYRVTYQGRKYDITHVSEEGVKKMMIITLQAVGGLNL